MICIDSCKRGHVNPPRIENGARKGRCKICISLWMKKLRQTDYYKKKQCMYTNTFRKNHPELCRRKYKEWCSNNKDKMRARVARRIADKLNACPKWTDKTSLRKVYLNCPAGYEVDHVIPLRGKEVCGLHVPWNLQYLTKEENMRKNNKLLFPYTYCDIILE